MEENKSNQGEDHRQDIYSKTIKAGKRTYFFDVRSTRANDYYLTITESKRRFNPNDEKHYYEKHKLFLYKEDFEKFIDGLRETVDYIVRERPEMTPPPEQEGSKAEVEKKDNTQGSGSSDLPEVNFEDLG